ncbi:MAG: hypothetical protein ABH863_04040 [Candidatus Micrarchaeota archaeon]
MYKMEVLHYPRLDTILLVEDMLRSAPNEMTRTALYRALEGRVMYQTLKVILNYLEKSNKITFVEGKIVWIFTNQKLDKAVKRGRKY